MILLKPIKLDKIWGYELWIASALSNGRQENFAKAAGENYPLLVKIIQANEKLSIQVHPDDEAALALEGKGYCGKTECWYVLDAKPEAKIVYGLKKDICAEELSKAVSSNTLEQYLNIVQVKKGDFIFIPSGTIHAVGGGLRLLEVQQPSDITYRLYDWGRPRELHVEKSLKVIKSNKLNKIEPFARIFSCCYFSLEQINVCGRGIIQESNRGELHYLLYVISGSGIIKECGSNKIEEILPERIFAAAPKEKVEIQGNSTLLKISPTQYKVNY